MKTIILLGFAYLVATTIYIKRDTKPLEIRVVDGKEYQVSSIHGQEVLISLNK